MEKLQLYDAIEIMNSPIKGLVTSIVDNEVTITWNDSTKSRVLEKDLKFILNWRIG